MYKSLIKYISDLFLRHEPVFLCKYQSEDLNNSQSNDKRVSVYINDTTYSSLNITTGIFVVTLNIYVLGQPVNKERDAILNIQDLCYSIANSVINKLDYSGATVHDFSIITVSHVNDTDSSGVRITLDLNVPLSGLCDDSEWRETPIDDGEIDQKINIKEKINKNIEINPIKLTRTPKC